MYEIKGYEYDIYKIDEYTIYNPNNEKLIVINPKCKLEANTVGEASFLIYSTHPHYDKIKNVKSFIEIKQDDDVIFRGRVTGETRDFNNTKYVDVEGAMAYFNDSYVEPFSFPEDYINDQKYIEASKNGNVIEFFLDKLIKKHNEQMYCICPSYDKTFLLGKVTVTDPNNYLFRESTEYMSTWEALKTKLFGSSLGGYLCIRYEEDGNYIDYLADFEETNRQKIELGENLIDIFSESYASEFYNVVIPLGAKNETYDEKTTDKSRVNIKNASAAFIGEPLVLVREKNMLYNRKLTTQYGYICAPVSETTWDDITNPTELLRKATDYLTNTATKFLKTITVKGIDLYFTDKYIDSFRIYKNVHVYSKAHGIDEVYRLTKLEIDILNPQNTVITLGDVQMSMTDFNANTKKESTEKIKSVETSLKSEINDFEEVNVEIDSIKTSLSEMEQTIDDVMQSVVEEDENLQNQINAIVDSLENEWIALTIADSFAAYDGLEENKPMYKLSGHTVEVKGCVVPLAEFTSSTEKVVFASGLPEGLCPSSIRSFICQGSGMNRWLLTVETDGTLTISRYGVSECVAVPTTEGLSFSGTYMI